MAPNIIVVPKWTIILRGIQILLAVIILGISAYGSYWIHFNSWAFAIFTSLVTILIVLYNILTTHTAALKTAYNQWAILGADSVGVIFWLSAMASLAATRATFVIPTTINECVNDGSGGVCDRRRRIRRDLHLNNVQKREFVATYGYLNLMSAAAVLAAVEMLLFASTLLIFIIHLQRQKRSHPTSPSSYDTENAATSGSKPQELNQISPIANPSHKYEPVQQQSQQYSYSSQEYAPQVYQQQ